jgi:hypothetical protein
MLKWPGDHLFDALLFADMFFSYKEFKREEEEEFSKGKNLK